MAGTAGSVSRAGPDGACQSRVGGVSSPRAPGRPRDLLWPVLKCPGPSNLTMPRLCAPLHKLPRDALPHDSISTEARSTLEALPEEGSRSCCMIAGALDSAKKTRGLESACG